MKSIYNSNQVLLPFRKIWQHFVTWFATREELQVWQKSDRHGRTFSWHAYDPISGRSACFGSEEEMRIWIEQSYYRQ